MSLYNLIQETGLSDPQEIADAIKASGVTARPINRAELIHLLNMRGMLRKIVSNNTSEKWEGTVLNMQDAILAMGTDEQKNGIRLWFSHVTNVSNNVWDTTHVAFAKPFREMVYTFAGMATMPTQEDFDAILALGGGWLYESLTAEQVQCELDTANKRTIVEAARTAVNSRTTAINAWLDALDVSAMTVEQVEAYVADLITSDDGNPSIGGE